MRVSADYKYAWAISNLIAWLEYTHTHIPHTKENKPMNNYKLKVPDGHLSEAMQGNKTMPNDEMELDSVFTFGKYTGDTVQDVIHDNPNYMAWLVENDVVPLSNDVINILAEEKII